jgi:dephospho-CoA kinase
MNVWGLTGNIACGKSLVEGMLRELGVPVVDADEVAREVVEPSEPALAEIRSEFGDGVLGADGRLDRKALGALVFSDPERRRKLEAITWPRVMARTMERLAALAARGEDLAVVSAALMVESGTYRNYSGLAIVICPEPEQIRRLMARDGIDEAAARARLAAQRPQAEKAALAQLVIDNGSTPGQTRAQVIDWVRAMRPGRERE